MLREELDDTPRAFDALLEAVRLDSSDDDAIDALEELAARLQRTPEFLDAIEVATRRSERAPHGALRLLERAVHAVRGVPGEERQLERYVARIRAIAPEHPAVVRRDADLYGEGLHAGACHEALERARVRAAGNEERDAHVALGRLYEAAPRKLDAARAHFVRAYELDRSSIPALEGLERVLSAMGKSRDVAAVLDRQASAASDTRTREGALLRAALVHEFDLDDPGAALGKYQRVLKGNPEHREARAGVDRCFEKNGAWDERAVDLLDRARRAEGGAEKARLFAELARLQEARLLDGDGAANTLLEAYAADDRHRGVLFDLARLAEKIADYPAASAYRARLASLLGDPETRARLYVHIGQMLAEGGRDRTAARLHFERAIAAGAAHVEAWEGLQELAECTGDDVLLAEALAMRAELSRDVSESVELYLELAGLKAGLGDARGATEAWETALALAPDNEEAARALLDEYVRRERWRDALPLCELLLRIAPPADARLAFELFDRTARHALACDDPARALRAAVSAFELRGEDPAARARVVELAFRLARIPSRWRSPAMRSTPRPRRRRLARTRSSLAAMALLRGDTDAAVASSSACSTSIPTTASLSRLGEIFVARGDWTRAAECKRRQAGIDSADEKFRLLVETGEILPTARRI